MRGIKRCAYLLKRTGTIHIFASFIIFLLIAAFVIMLIEPGAKTYIDGLWYCFIASTTVGFGDIYAVTLAGRIITVLVTIYGIMATAMIPGVVLAYYLEYLKVTEKETISTFMEKLENLPELSKEELKDLSERVKEFKKNIK